MKKLLVLLTLVCSSLFMSGQAFAISLSLIPSLQNLEPESVASVTVNIFGLSDGGSPSLGALDLELNYNPSVLSFQVATFGSFLGDEGLGEVISNVDSSIPGVVKLSEISLLEGNSRTCVFCTGPFLDKLQEDMFSLATLRFGSSLALGSSSIDFNKVVLSDAQGTALPVSSISGAVINVVPEPSTMLLLMTGLIGMAGSRWRQSRPPKTLR